MCVTLCVCGHFCCIMKKDGLSVGLHFSLPSRCLSEKSTVFVCQSNWHRTRFSSTSLPLLLSFPLFSHPLFSLPSLNLCHWLCASFSTLYVVSFLFLLPPVFIFYLLFCLSVLWFNSSFSLLVFQLVSSDTPAAEPPVAVVPPVETTTQPSPPPPPLPPPPAERTGGIGDSRPPSFQ